MALRVVDPAKLLLWNKRGVWLGTHFYKPSVRPPPNRNLPLKLVEEWGFVLRTAGTYACHLRGQNLANTVSELLHPEHGTPYRYISVRQPSADYSSSLGSKLISSNAPTYDFYLRELLRSEFTYLLKLRHLVLNRNFNISSNLQSNSADATDITRHTLNALQQHCSSTEKGFLLP